jgi:hypothetical protein
MQRPGRREKNHAKWCSSNLNLRRPRPIAHWLNDNLLRLREVGRHLVTDPRKLHGGQPPALHPDDNEADRDAAGVMDDRASGNRAIRSWSEWRQRIHPEVQPCRQRLRDDRQPIQLREEFSSATERARRQDLDENPQLVGMRSTRFRHLGRYPLQACVRSNVLRLTRTC